MTYKLTLTKGERDAFDWIGDRYSSTGNQAAELIQEGMPSDKSWSDSEDITFDIPEGAAWGINDLAESEDFSWPCFSEALASKMNQFCGEIV